MNTLMIASKTQGPTFDAETAVASFAVVEKLAQFAGRVLKAMTPSTEAGAVRLARA